MRGKEQHILGETDLSCKRRLRVRARLCVKIGFVLRHCDKASSRNLLLTPPRWSSRTGTTCRWRACWRMVTSRVSVVREYL